MKKYYIIQIFILIIFNSNLFSQPSSYFSYQLNNYPTDKVDIVTDMCFVNYNTGYVTAFYYENTTNAWGYVYKTTNSGINWSLIWKPWFQPFNTSKFAVSFYNANTGYFVMKGITDRIWKTTNGGINCDYIFISGFQSTDMEPVLATNSNSDLFLIRKTKNFINKFPHPMGTTFYQFNFAPGIQLYHIDVSKTNNYIYVCGDKNTYPFLARSTDNGQTYNYISYFDGESDNYQVGPLRHLDIINYNGIDVIKISGNNKLFEYNTNSNLVTILSSYEWGQDRKISFGDMSNGFYIEPTSGSQAILKTTNNGQNWGTPDFSGGLNILNFTNRFYSYGNVIYFTSSNEYSKIAQFHKRKLSMYLNSYYDNIQGSGNIRINGIDYTTEQSQNFYYLFGREVSLYSEPIFNENTSNEKIFYKWNNYVDLPFINNVSISDFNMFHDGNLSNYYKTKLKSSTSEAISNPNQTKAIRDTTIQGGNTIIHQIHESMGGIFYSRKTDNETNFSTEEIINNDLPEGNNNSFLSIMRTFDGKPMTLYNHNKNVAVIWERYNQTASKTELIIANRTDNLPSGYKWVKYYDYGTGQYVFSSFNNSNSNFKSHPKVFVSASPYDINLNNSVIVVPHLRPNGNNTSLYFTVRYGTQIQNMLVEDGTISDLSVTAEPYNNYGVFRLHSVFKKDGIFKYRKDEVGYDNLASNIYRQVIDSNTNLSNGDEQISRYTPDISLRNGRPVLAYQGYNKIYRIISFDEDAPVTQTIFRYPIIVRYKYLSSEPNVGEVWSDFVKYNSDGINTQQNPNVEGSKDANAYVVNFSVANSYFKQFVLIKDYPGYSCNPGIFPGKDAKLVRGSYQGNFGTNSYPTLLTLTQNGSLYDVWKQTFTITNTPSSENPNTNLVGVVRDLDINYYFNLGPVIAKNILYSPENGNEILVENPVEFNENMISQPFSLSNGDTLLVGGLGSYSYYPGCDFRIKKFDVNLMIKSTNQLQRNLFSDTIQYEDSIETEYLRGFIIDNIQNGTDSFYIQLVVAPEDITDGIFLYSNVYSPDEEGGDNPGGTKSRYVLFEKGKSGNNQNIPTEYSLSQNYPNPFNPITTIQFQVPSSKFVKLVVYDVLGREVKNLINEVKMAGRYTVLLDGSDLASGVYFYRIESGDFVQVKRMILLK